MDDDFYEGCFLFDPDDPIYVDHFPGNPVVPGSIIVHAFLAAASGSTSEPTQKVVHNFRFKRFIRPGRYAYRMQRKADGSLACALLDNQITVVTGNINL